MNYSVSCRRGMLDNIVEAYLELSKSGAIFSLGAAEQLLIITV